MNPEKNIPIWLAITPTAAAIRVGTTMVSTGHREGGIEGEKDGFS